MVKLLWRKIMRDFWIAKGRILMMIIAIAVGIFGVTSILSSYTILNREISRNYLGTNPAAAQLELNQVDHALVAKVRQRPGIVESEASSVIFARIERKPNEWLPILLFVVNDFNTMRINMFKSYSGAWPPPKGTVLLEKDALPLLNGKIGDTHRIKTPHGSIQTIAISGLVHDPGLAPAWQEQTVYGYITPATQAQLGEGMDLHILKVTVRDHPFNQTYIEKTVGNLAIWLKQQGYRVDNIRIPPPGMHPHQSQMNSIQVLFLIFSFLALILSAILTSTLISGLLSQQIRQIGIMKSIGARSVQIAGAYIAMVITTCIVAITIGLPLGIAASRGVTTIVAQLLNLKIYSYAIPNWVYLVLLLVGILVPFQIAHRPISLTSRITVREAINDFGISRKMFGARRLDKLLGKIKGIDRTLAMALRNTFRRQARLILTLSLLGAAGGMFITSLNVKTSWEYYVRNAASNRHYDLEIRLNRPESAQKMQNMIGPISGVRKVETWNMRPAAVNRPNELDIERTYPDGGHGSFTLRSVPPGSKMMQSPLIIGRWLRPDDGDVVVLNHMASTFYPSVKVGESIKLLIEGRPIQLTVVGIAREILTPATAYVPPRAFTEAAGLQGQSNALRIAMDSHDLNGITMIAKQIERKLEMENISIKALITEKMLDGALNGHIYIFIIALLMMAVLMAIVGALGLMSAMGANVLERTREFGVMRTIGGKSATIIRNVILEGIFIGLMSWVIGTILSLPLSAGIDNLVGTLSFRSPLPLILAPSSMLVWLTIIVFGAIAASAYPAWKASQLTIRETLSYI